jgi:hypothetical protein
VGSGVGILYFGSHLHAGYLSLRNPVFLTYTLTTQAISIFCYASVGALMLVAFPLLKGKMQLSLSQWITLAIGYAAIAQLYPSPDPQHVWWIAPVCIVATARVFIASESFRNYESWRVPVSLLLIITLIIGGVTCLENLRVKRVGLNDSVLNGMLDRSGEVTSQTLKLLGNHLKQDSKIKFDCHDGIYAGVNRRFTSISPYFVDWGMPKNYVYPKDYNEDFFCYSSKEKIYSAAANHGKVAFLIPSGFPNEFNALVDVLTP